MKFKTETILLFLLLLSVFQSIVIAQPNKPRFEHLTTNDGLTNNSVTHLFQDKKGFLWISTRNGLSRYDGQVFKNYEYIPGEINSLSDNEVNFVLEDSKGLFWIATQDGLNILNPLTEKISQFSLNNLLSSNELTAIAEDKFGNIWIGTRKGLNRFNPKTNEITVFKNERADKNNLSNNIIKSIYSDKNGNLWIGTVKGLCKFNYQSNSFYVYLNDSSKPNSVANNVITYIAEDRKGSLWAGTINGLSKVILEGDEINFENYFFDDGTENTKKLNRIRSFDNDCKGNLWIGTIGGGLVLFDPLTKKYSNYKYSQNDISSINDNEIFAICVDNFDNVWIGSSKRGISKFSPTKSRFDLFKPETIVLKDVPDNDITAVYADEENRLWMGTNGNGVLVYQMDADYYPVKLLFELKKKDNDGLSSNYITSILEDKDGYYWIGTLAGGLIKFNPSTKKIEIFKSYWDDSLSLSNNYINTIYEDSKGYLWVGTSAGGVNKFDKKNNSFTRYTYDPVKPQKNLNSPEVTSICEDNNGNLLFGTTTGGLNIFNRNTEEFTYYTYSGENKNGISSRKILCIYKDKKRRLWIGTYGGGLNFFLKNSFIQFGKKDGLASNIIYSIKEDDAGNLWLATYKGISIFNPESKEVKNFDESDGLQGKEFNPRAIVKHPKSGAIYFGGTRGLNIYNHRSISNVLTAPPVFLTDFKIFYKSVIPGEDSPIQESISYAKGINLSYDQNVISFSFSALDFTSPEKNEYAYKLEGFDKAWIYSGNIREVTYTNLNSGNYTFKVKASNSDGIWNKDVTKIFIVINPPFWATWWAYTIYVILFISGLALIRATELKRKRKKEEERIRREREAALLREAELKAKNIEQEKEIEKQKIRNRIAQDLHDEIGSNLSSISLMSELIQNDEKINAEDSERIKRIHKVAKGSTQAMRDIVWLTNPSSDSLKDLIAKMKEVADDMLGKIILNFDYPKEFKEVNLLPETKRNIFFIYKETLNNIVKHSDAKIVWINFDIENSNIFLSIKDDGNGFNASTGYGGNGLKNIKARAKEISADLKFESTPGKGTLLELSVNITQMRD
jgi:ligand-binding sensor domain-containing protein/signal transduction histidine kinase